MRLTKKFLCTAGAVFLLGSSNLYAQGESAKEILNKAYQYVGSLDQ